MVSALSLTILKRFMAKFADGYWSILAVLWVMHAAGTLAVVLVALHQPGMDMNAKFGTVTRSIPIPVAVYLLAGFVGLCAASLIGIVRLFVR